MKKETIGDIDILVISSYAEKVMKKFTKKDRLLKVISRRGGGFIM